MSENQRARIMAGSPAWTRLQDGIPREIEDIHLRRMFHDYANVTTIIVGELERALDEIDRLHARVERRKDDHEALKDKLFDPDEGSFAKLNDKLYNPKTGNFIEAKNYVDTKFGKFTGPLFALLGSVMAGLILLAATRLTGG